MSSTYGSKRATNQGKTDLDREVERLQTNPKLQGHVNRADAESSALPPTTEWQLDDEPREPPSLDEKRTEAGNETVPRTSNEILTTDWAVWV